MEIPVLKQVNDETPQQCIIIGFSCSGTYGSTPVAIYYNIADKLKRLYYAPITDFRIY
jgi:hypothetical protein